MKKVTDHEGNHYRTIKDMCEHYGIKPYVYQQRRRAGWSMREALTKPVATYVRTTKGVRDHLGNFYPTVKAMCKAYNIAEATYHRRRRQGASMKEALEHKIIHQPQKVQDHLGNWYPTLNAMCKAYGITTSAYCYRKQTGRTLEECLTQPITKVKKVKDHKGNVYATIADMCKAYDVSYNVYHERRRRGKTVEEALTNPAKQIIPYERPDGPVIDHLGIEHESFEAMCREYEVVPDTCVSRLSRGQTLEEALRPSKGLKPVKDHLGNEYPTVTALCKHYGINYSSYMQQKARGYSLEEIISKQRQYEGLDGNVFPSLIEMAEHYNLPYSAVLRAHATLSHEEFLNYLRNPEQGFGPFCVKDHKGQQFKSTEDMVKHYGITRTAYNQRLRKLKWSLEKTLTTPVRNRRKVIEDHKGNTYQTIDELAGTYGITKGVYWARLKLGWSLEKTLTTPIQGQKK